MPAGSSRAAAVTAGAGACLLLLGAFQVAALRAQRGNTLTANGRWTSDKTRMAYPVNHSFAYMQNRVALSGNRLHLDAYHGYQQVISREAYPLRELSLVARLAPDAELSILYLVDEQGSRGIRLSRHPLLRSVAFRATPSGAFLDAVPIAPPLGHGSHRVRVLYGQQRVEVRVDGVPVVSRDLPRPAALRVGFRGGLRPGSVDDVVLRLADGTSVGEGFERPPGAAQVLACFAAACLLVAPLVAWRGRRSVREGALLLLVLGFDAALCTGIVRAADLYVLSARHPPTPALPFPRSRAGPPEIEIAPDVVTRIAATYEPVPQRGPLVFFLGGSQTWGAGADRKDRTFVALLEQRLRRELDPRTSCVNLGIPGGIGSGEVTLYRERWFAMRPDLVVANFGHNDADPEALARAVRELVCFDQERGIATLLSLEPNPVELRVGDSAKHRAMRAVALREGVPLVDLNRCLARRRDRGFLFWDLVHLAPFGHEAAADCLHDAVLAALRSARRSALLRDS